MSLNNSLKFRFWNIAIVSTAENPSFHRSINRSTTGKSYGVAFCVPSLVSGQVTQHCESFGLEFRMYEYAIFRPRNGKTEHLSAESLGLQPPFSRISIGIQK